MILIIKDLTSLLLLTFVKIFGSKILSHMGQAFNKYQWECARNKHHSNAHNDLSNQTD